MLTQKANRHHSRLPEIGKVGYLVDGNDRYLGPKYWYGRRQKYIVEAYPLNDNVSPWSIGIHTAYFRNLANNQIIRMSGIYFCEA